MERGVALAEVEASLFHGLASRNQQGGPSLAASCPRCLVSMTQFPQYYI